MNVFGAAAAHTIDEVRVMIACPLAGGSWHALIGQPRFVGVVSISGKVALGSVENVADGIGFRIFRPQGLLIVTGLLGCANIQSRSGHTACLVSASANLQRAISISWMA